MNPGDRITLRMNRRPGQSAEAVIDGMGDGEQLCSLHITAPPVWFRKTLQARGVFLGPSAVWNMTLFRDHRQTWTDTSALEQWTMEVKP